MAKRERIRTRRATPEQMRALASPIRIEMIGLFQSYGPMAIRELAERLSRPADGLYHHVRQLLRVGILRLEQTRRVGKRDEAEYELTAERVGHQEPPKSPSMKKALADSAAGALRLASREFQRTVLASP